MNIVLMGDSIFDNARYVGEKESVFNLLSQKLDNGKVTLLAVDGDITINVKEQLERLPDDATHVFLSCGGNDALRALPALNIPFSEIEDALSRLWEIKECFREKYIQMLSQVLEKSGKLMICTIYNKVPTIPEEALTALALFNEVILEEAFKMGLPVIDLRLTCNEPADYSNLSPIEPSLQSGIKIVNVIEYIVADHVYDSSQSIIYS